MGRIDTLLLLALPASGKSELRRYIEHLDPDVRSRDLHLSEPVHLDDYPYVHLMRRISEELGLLGTDPVFFGSSSESFREPGDWGTLVELLADDWAGLRASPVHPHEPAAWLLDRLDRARARVGLVPRFGRLDAGVRAALEAAISPDAGALAEQLAAGRPLDVEARTVVLEFARGGPEGAEPPLAPPLGYRHALSLLPPALTERATVLYVWVTPEESRRRNRERARPGPQGDASILHHGVPERVMSEDYGTDDMSWLLRNARIPGTLTVPGPGRVFDVPAVVFDNRDDLTSFLRDDPSQWPGEALERLHRRLSETMQRLWDETRARWNAGR